MAKFNVSGAQMEGFQTPSGLKFSGQKLDTLDATQYSLVNIAIDVSSSTSRFKSLIDGALRAVVEGLKHDPYCDNLMLRVTTFSHDLTELHGFKEYRHISYDADYKDKLNCYGYTALYRASLEGVEALRQYAQMQNKKRYSVNGLLVVITDGEDNQGLTPKDVGKAMEDLVTSEMMESFVSVLVGLNVDSQHMSQYLKDFADQAGFTKYLEASDATSATFAKLVGFVSKSISLVSQSLGTGGPSQSLTTGPSSVSLNDW